MLKMPEWNVRIVIEVFEVIQGADDNEEKSDNPGYRRRGWIF